MKARRIASTIGLGLLLLPLGARAQDDVPADGEPTSEAPVEVAAEGQVTGEASTPSTLARERDASVDRGFLAAHADTLFKGDWTINSYELFFLGASYGATDTVQVSLFTSLPIIKGFPFILSGSAKWAFFRTDSLVLSLRGLVAWGTTFGDEDSDSSDGTSGNEGIGILTMELLLDYYFDDRGRYALHAGLQAGGAFGTGFNEGGVDFGDGATFLLNTGFTLGFGERIKVLLEAMIPAFTTPDTGFEVADFVMLNYGIRVHGENYAGDIGFLRPVGNVDDPFILGLPFVAFTARF